MLSVDDGVDGIQLGFDNEECWEPALPRLPVDLLLALPRPKVALPPAIAPQHDQTELG